MRSLLLSSPRPSFLHHVDDVRDHSADTASFTAELLRAFNDPSPDANVELLLADEDSDADFTIAVKPMPRDEARALGALDILDKGQMAPSNLDDMLQRLKIPQRGRSNGESAHHPP